MDALLGTKSRGDAWGAKEEPLAEPQTLQSLNLQHVDDGTEYIDDADTGISGVLRRTIEVDEEEFKKRVGIAVQQEMEAALVDRFRTSWWSRAPKSVLGLPMISPKGNFTIVWMSIITILDLTYVAFWVPLNVAFCSENFGDIGNGCVRADFSFGIIYTIHLLLNLSVGINLTHEAKKKVIIDGVSVMELYIVHGRFWLDFVSVVPFVYLVFIVGLGVEPTPWVTFVSLIRLVRMGRLVSIGKIFFLDAQRGLEGTSSTLVQRLGGSRTAIITLVIFFVCVLINFEASMLILVANIEGQENSWMLSFLWQDLVNANVFLQWYNAVFLAIASNTQTGAAGAKFIGLGEMAVCAFMQLTGMVMFSIVTTIGLRFATRISKYAMDMHKLGDKLKKVHAFVESYHLPEHIHKRIQDFYYDIWLQRAAAVKEDAIITEMPPAMLAALLPPLTLKLVRSCHYLGDSRETVQLYVAQVLEPVEIMAGLDLCSEGEPSRCCWLLEEGMVLATNMQGGSEMLTAPCLFGETFIIGDDIPTCRERLWRYEVFQGREVGVPARLWRLKAADLPSLLRASPDLRINLLRYLQGKLVFTLTPGIEPGTFLGADHHWNELISRITCLLKRSNPALVHDVRDAVLQADADLGSLSTLLDALLSLSMIQDKHARNVAGAPLLSVLSEGAETHRTSRGKDPSSGQLPTLSSLVHHPPLTTANLNRLQVTASGRALPAGVSQSSADNTAQAVKGANGLEKVSGGGAGGIAGTGEIVVSERGDVAGPADALLAAAAAAAVARGSVRFSIDAALPAPVPAPTTPRRAHEPSRNSSPRGAAADAAPPVAPILSYSPHSPGRPPPPQWVPLPADPTLAEAPLLEPGGSPLGALSRTTTANSEMSTDLGGPSRRNSAMSRAQREEAAYLTRLARNPATLVRPPAEKVWQPARVRRRSGSGTRSSFRPAHGGDELLEAAAAVHACSDSELQSPAATRSRRASAEPHSADTSRRSTREDATVLAPTDRDAHDTRDSRGSTSGPLPVLGSPPVAGPRHRRLSTGRVGLPSRLSVASETGFVLSAQQSLDAPQVSESVAAGQQDATVPEPQQGQGDRPARNGDGGDGSTSAQAVGVSSVHLVVSPTDEQPASGTREGASGDVGQEGGPQGPLVAASLGAARSATMPRAGPSTASAAHGAGPSRRALLPVRSLGRSALQEMQGTRRATADAATVAGQDEEPCYVCGAGLCSFCGQPCGDTES